jgi:hypothetical protein
MDTRVKPAYDIMALSRHPKLCRAPHADPARQRIRHGLSRRRPGAAAGVRAWLAVRLPHLVVRARAADKTASRDRGVPAALLSRALGRCRRHLFDRAACRRHDRVYRGARCRAGRPNGTFPRRAHLVPGRAAAAGSAAQADPGRARRRARCHARSGLQARPLPARGEVRGIGGENRGRRCRWRIGVLHGCAGRPRRLESPPRHAQAVAARQRDDPHRAGQRQPSAIFKGRCGGDQNADAVDRRRQHQGRIAQGASRLGGACGRRENGNDPGHDASDVRTSAAKILRDRAGISGGG